MLVATYDRTGPANEVLRVTEFPTPTPGPNEVRVRLAWSGVNPSDVKTRAGSRTRVLPFPQIVPHSDGSGTIDAVGPNISSARIGERVWIWNGAWGRAHGTAAQYIVLPANQAVQLPENIDLAAGACLGIPALTAYHAVGMNGGVQGKSVLIAGGAGAVGHYAIQFAKIMGARRILSTISSDRKAALAKAAGADVAINYKNEDVAARVQAETAGQGVERIIEVDFGANVALDQQVLKRDGDIVVYGSTALEIALPFVPMLIKNIQLRFFIVYNLTEHDRTRAIEELTALLKGNRLQHNVAERVSLNDIVKAHEMVEQGRVVGNVLVQIP